MNWEKSKTIIIWLLIALNLYLLAVNTIFKTIYYIRGEQEKSIIELLSKNGIGIYDEIDIKYKPLAPLNILASDSDIDEKAYMGHFVTSPEIIEEDNKIIATENSKTIIFENGFTTLFINDENDYISYGENLEKFVKELAPAYKNFAIDKKFRDGDKTIYEFRDVYKERVIYTNYLSVEVIDNRIVGIQGFYGKALESKDKPREVASIDMVLYTFMEEAKMIYGEDKNLFITSVDLVYYQEEYSAYDEVIENTAKAIPCYRIYSEGEELPFIISAYENKVIN